jgi:hypothetical protein
VTKRAPDDDTPSGRTAFSTLNNVFFVILLIAVAIGGIVIALNKL